MRDSSISSTEVAQVGAPSEGRTVTYAGIHTHVKEVAAVVAK